MGLFFKLKRLNQLNVIKVNTVFNLAHPRVESVIGQQGCINLPYEVAIVILVFSVSEAIVLIVNKRRFVSGCYSNAMRSTFAFVAPSATSDRHNSAVIAPVAPEADLVPVLEIPVALGTTKPHGIIVLAAILHVTAPEARVIGPDFTASEIAISRHLGAECLSAQTPTRGLQQCWVARVVAACDLELGAVDQPKGGRDHVCVVCRVDGLTDGGCSVVPIVTAVFHPVFDVVVGEAGDQSPALFVGRHVTISLRYKMKFSINVKLHLLNNT